MGPRRPLDHVAPMRIHIGDKSTASIFSIIPARSLGSPLQSIEYPPAEFQFKPGHPAKNHPSSAAPTSAFQANELVLYHTMFEAPRIGFCQNSQSFFHPRCNRFFRIDMLARCKRFVEEIGLVNGSRQRRNRYCSARPTKPRRDRSSSFPNL